MKQYFIKSKNIRTIVSIVSMVINLDLIMIFIWSLNLAVCRIMAFWSSLMITVVLLHLFQFINDVN